MDLGWCACSVNVVRALQRKVEEQWLDVDMGGWMEERKYGQMDLLMDG